MQRCRSNDVSSVRREIMWRRVRPILAHTNVISHTRPVAKASFSLKAMRGRIALLKHFVRKSGEAIPLWRRTREGSREFPPEEFHLPLRTTDAVAVLLDAVSVSAYASPLKATALRSLFP